MIGTSELKRCCNGGKFLLDLIPYPKLKPLPDELLDMYFNDKSFGEVSNVYNNLLSFAATGVNNEHGGKFESIVGDHSRTMCC